MMPRALRQRLMLPLHEGERQRTPICAVTLHAVRAAATLGSRGRYHKTVSWKRWEYEN